MCSFQLALHLNSMFQTPQSLAIQIHRLHSPWFLQTQLTRAHSSWIVIFISYHVRPAFLLWAVMVTWPQLWLRIRGESDCEGTQVLSQNRSFLCIIFKQDSESGSRLQAPENPEGLVSHRYLSTSTPNVPIPSLWVSPWEQRSWPWHRKLPGSRIQLSQSYATYILL